MVKTVSKETDLKHKLVTRLDLGLEKHERYVTKPLKRYRKYYEGKQWSDDLSKGVNNETVDNMVYTVVTTIQSSMNINKPVISVSPRKSNYTFGSDSIPARDAAARHRILSQFLFDELDIQDTMEQVLTDALLGPFGAVKIGFNVEVGEIQGDQEDEFLEVIENEQLFVDRISPMDLIVDPEAVDPTLKDANWIAIKWVKTPEEVQKEFKKKVEPNGFLVIEKAGNDIFKRFATDLGGSRADGLKGEENSRIEGYEIWDRKERVVYNIVREHPEVLSQTEWPLKYKRFPVELLWFNFVPDRFTPLADTELYINKQDSLNMVESKILDHITKLTETKYAANRTKVTKSDTEKWAKAPSGAVLLGKGDPSTFVTEVQKGGVSQDLYINVQKMRNDILSQLGVSSFEASGASEGASSATEASLISQGASTRRSFRVSKYERFLSRLMDKLVSVASQTLPESIEVPVEESQFDSLIANSPEVLQTNDFQDGDEVKREFLPFVMLDKQLLGGKFTFKVKVVQAGAESELKMRNDAVALMELAERSPLINRIEAVKMFLEAFGFGTDMDRLLRDPNEVAQEQQAAFSKQVQAQVAVDQPKRDTDLLKTQLKSITGLLQTGMTLDQKSGAEASEDATKRLGEVIKLATAKRKEGA